MSNNTNQKMDTTSKRRNPDLFRAAKENNIEEMADALEEGETLSDHRPDMLNMTPIHVACIYSSNKFLAAASNHETFDPWVRDDNLRLAFDHASAKKNKVAMNLLHAKMYPADWDKQGEVIEFPQP